MVDKDKPLQKTATARPKRKRAAAVKPSGTTKVQNPPDAVGTVPPSSVERPAKPEAEDLAKMFAPPGPEALQTLEALSRNLAKAAMTAQGAIAEAALRQADRGPGLDADPFHVGPAMAKVISSLAGRPDVLLQAQGDLWRRYAELWHFAARRAMGDPGSPAASPAKGDKRFTAPDWTENPVFDVIKQSYLITSDWLNGLVARADDVDPLTRRRVEFFTRMLTDALSPSNFLASNPEALREAMTTQGESLVKGMENFAGDLARGGGQLAISQTDYEQFEIGVNVATAPGKVIFQNEIIQLIQFSPSTDQVHEIPLVIFPPWINKFYILDLRPENSMIRWLAAQGFTVFVASWVNPDGRLADKTFEDYMRLGIYEGTAAAMKQAGVDRVNTVGYCIGGTLLSATLAHMAAKGDKRIASATFFAAQQDFSEAGDLLLFTSDEWLSDLEKQMESGGGVLAGQTMADTFNMLRSNDLIWSFFVSNYLLGKEPKPFDLLFWNSDQTRMPRTLHLEYLRRFYGDNALAKGELELDGIKLDLGQVQTPVYVQSSKEDHIAPARSVYKGARLFGGPTTFTLAGSGHIAGVINAPVANKYQHWTNASLPDTLEAWQAGAVETPGSWWPHWAEWLRARSGALVPARDPASGPLPALEDAPGSYVKVKS